MCPQTAQIGAELTRYSIAGPVLNDLIMYDSLVSNWMTPPTYGVSPSPRFRHGFSWADAKLYVFGGQDPFGNCCETIRDWCVNKPRLKITSCASGLITPSEAVSYKNNRPFTNIMILENILQE